MNVDKKNIIVTGASRGIGFELIKLLAEQGHQVLAISRNIKPIGSLSKSITCLSVDLSANDGFKQIESFVEKEWKTVDIVIHNAGKLIHKPFKDTKLEDYLAVYKVNVFGLAELTRVLLPFLNKGSHVVAISSMGGIQGSMKFAGLSAYSSSKAAVITLIELLAEEYKDEGISFNTLALGAVQTEMLAEAFPDYKAPTSAFEMAAYIAEFSLNGNQFYNGKTLQVSSSTP